MNRTRTLRAILVAPIVSAGLLSSALIATAPAFAAPPSGCSSMAMPADQTDAGTPNSLTRAGQIAAATAPAPAPDAPMDCTAASHG